MTSSPSELQELAEAWQADPTKHPWTCNGGNGNFASAFQALRAGQRGHG